MSESVSLVNAKAFTVKKASDDTTVESITTTATGAISVNAATVTIRLSRKTLGLANTDYYVQMDSGIVQDATLNNYVGIADKTTWNFRTSAGSEFAAGG
eukprot:GFYU01077239.1.p1 GENE.GFYU01077239.1~~GFYU01077239.1.p1  ORF type:complete len:109 (-),score=34.95 GFYU01077239.1:14-310(-)